MVKLNTVSGSYSENKKHDPDLNFRNTRNKITCLGTKYIP